jgi:N-acetylglutamate synthase-like GNAT family acetyltransferase
MIRRATTDDAATLTNLAVAAKRYWGYPENWIEQWRHELTISRDFVNDNEVYVLTNDEEVRGFYGMVLRKEKAELEHLWVAPQYIGSGVGRKLFTHALQLAAEHDIAEVEITSDPNAEGFYKKMGARRIGEVRADMDENPRSIPRLSITP